MRTTLGDYAGRSLSLGSEMFFNTTAFETTYNIAGYGVENQLELDARGWLEVNFYPLGSDARQHGNKNYLLR